MLLDYIFVIFVGNQARMVAKQSQLNNQVNEGLSLRVFLVDLVKIFQQNRFIDGHLFLGEIEFDDHFFQIRDLQIHIIFGSSKNDALKLLNQL